MPGDRRIVESAFAILHRIAPGQWRALEAYMMEAPPDIQLDFMRLTQNLETEQMALKRKAREPWRR